MNKSDSWRVVRHDNAVQETAYITQAVSDFCRMAAEDDKLTVSWEPIGGYAVNMVKEKRIYLNPSLVKDKEAPFDGSFVDELCGFATHEAGHSLIGASYSRNGRFDVKNAWSQISNEVWNIVEDFAIDGEPMAQYNKQFGELTHQIREVGQVADDNRQGILEHWNDTASGTLSPEDLLTIWSCSHLFRQPLPALPDRAHEQSFMRQMDVHANAVMHSRVAIGDQSLVTSVLYSAALEIQRILQNYGLTPPPQGGGQSGGQSSPQSGGQGQSGDSSGEAGEKAEKPEQGSGDKGEGTKPEAGPKGPGDGENAGEKPKPKQDASGSKTEAGGHGAGGGGAGGATKRKALQPCPTAPEAPKPMTREEQAKLVDFVNDVMAECKRLEMERLLRNGDVNAARILKPFTNTKVMGEIRNAYMRLAEQPSRKRHEERGRVDRKRLSLAVSGRSDVFTQQSDRKIDGTLCIVLDLSGSTSWVEPLIKQIAANTYVALRPTDIKLYIYGYGDGCYQIASPERVMDFAKFGADGGTPTGLAINTAIAEVTPKGSSVLMHVTDGVPDNMTTAKAALAAAEKAGWHIINIGVSCSETYGSRFPLRILQSYTELPAIITDAVKAIARRGRLK